VIAEFSAVGEPLAEAQAGRYDRAPGSQAEMTTLAELPGGLTRRRT
jgi:hypothetical protein